MKFKNLSLCIFAAAMSLQSCNLDNDPDDNNSAISFSVCNLVSSDQEAAATRGDYTLTIFPYQNNLTVSTSNLSAGNETYSFVTSAMNINSQYYTDTNGQLLEILKFSGGTYNADNVSVTNFNGFKSDIVNTPSDPDILFPFVINKALVMQYRINNRLSVKTFMPDVVYTGSTRLRTNSTGESFSFDGTRYRVKFSNDMQTADVIFYGAKFAENMPLTVDFVLQNLKVNYMPEGYTITNNDETLIPQMYAGQTTRPFPTYQFSSFLLSNFSNDLTEATVNYWIDKVDAQSQEVTEKYFGEFTGSYVISGPAEN